jgi:hypothetical protein
MEYNNMPFNIAGNLRQFNPIEAARRGRAIRASTRHQELTNEALQRKIDIAPEREAYERRTAKRQEDAEIRQASMDKIQGLNEILQGIETEDDWERSREALTTFGGSCLNVLDSLENAHRVFTRMLQLRTPSCAPFGNLFRFFGCVSIIAKTFHAQRPLFIGPHRSGDSTSNPVWAGQNVAL